MVPLLVKQAVQMKIKRQRSVLVGNYEFYYAAGLYAAEHPGCSADGKMMPQDLKAALMEDLDQETYLPAEDPDRNLCFLLHRYRVEEDAHDQVMEGLFAWAKTGDNPFPPDAE